MLLHWLITQKLFAEHQLHAKHCSRCWDNDGEQEVLPHNDDATGRPQNSNFWATYNSSIQTQALPFQSGHKRALQELSSSSFKLNTELCCVQVKGTEPGVRMPDFTFWLCFLDERDLGQVTQPLCYSFLIWKWRYVIVLPQRIFIRTKRINMFKYWEQCLKQNFLYNYI